MPISPPIPEDDRNLVPPGPSSIGAVEPEPERRPCPAPANFRAEVFTYDSSAKVGRWDGPRYRMTYRVLGEGPPLFLIPGIASTYRVYSLLLNRLAEHFQTILYDYPGEHADDGARLGQISHDHLVDDLFRLIDHLNIGRSFLVGLSFGSTITLRALLREPRRFPRSAIQGGFAHRRFSAAERWALRLGRMIPGTAASLPLRRQILSYNSRPEFPALLNDRWDFYVEQNSLTPIRSLAHRVDLLTRFDLRPLLPTISAEVLLLQGREDRIVPHRDFEALRDAIPKAESVVMPTVGHQPHITHAEILGQLIHQFLLPCAEGPGGCTERNACS